MTCCFRELQVQAPLVSWTAAVAQRERRLDDNDSGWLIRKSTVGEGFSGATVDGFMATCDGCGFMATSQWREPLPAMERWTSAGNDMVTLLAAGSSPSPSLSLMTSGLPYSKLERKTMLVGLG
jgi:hypothetical protein